MARVKALSKSHRILVDLLATPTAPFAEHVVLERIKRFCAKRKGVTARQDTAGNLFVRVKQGKRRVARPVCITAHLDHPGFVTDKMTGPRRLCAFWRGGVPTEYFVGAKVRFYVDGAWVKGTVRSVKTVTRLGRERVDTASVEVNREVPSGSIGMWDFPDPVIRDKKIYARGCDDLAGAGAMLA